MTKTSRGLGCLILFALPFAAAGIFVGFLAAKMLWLWVKVQDWQEVPAQIVHTRLESHTGDDSTTYEAEARFVYEFGGLAYEGDRVGLGTGADNIGSFHQDKYAELTRYRQSGELFPCYVDPDDPSHAVLYREARWGLFSLMSLLALVFAGVGLGLIFGGFRGRKKIDSEEQLEALHPSEPWHWRSEWQDGRIDAAGKSQFIFPAIFALFWNLVSLPLLFVLPEEVLDKDNYLALIGLVFPLVGLGLIVWATRAFIRWQKFGDSVLEMSTLPGLVGGPLAGRVLTSTDLKPANGFLLTLSCVNRVRKGSGKNGSTSERLLWQEDKRLMRESAEFDPTRSEIPIFFSIPIDASPSDRQDTDDQVLWRLQVEAEVPGVDYHASFEVPVFKTDASRTEPAADAKDDIWEAEPAPAIDLAAHGIHSELLSTGARRLTFGAARHKGPALGVTAFLMVWLGLTYLLIHLDAPLLFPIVWGLSSLLLLYGVLDLWLEKRWVEIHSDRLQLSGGILGIGKTHPIQRTEIEEIEPVRGMQAGNKLYYRLQIRTHDGKKHIAATKIGSLSLARHIAELLS